jgi:hypothetical protein
VVLVVAVESDGAGVLLGSHQRGGQFLRNVFCRLFGPRETGLRWTWLWETSS